MLLLLAENLPDVLCHGVFLERLALNNSLAIRADRCGLIVEVGALTVGSIVQTFTPSRVTRGQEKSYFRFGGSALLMLAQSRRVRFDDDLIRATSEGVESRVRVGTRVAVKCR